MLTLSKIETVNHRRVMMANRRGDCCCGAAFTTPTSKTSRTGTLSLPSSRVFALACLTHCCYLLIRNKALVTDFWPDAPCGRMLPLCFSLS